MRLFELIRFTVKVNTVPVVLEHLKSVVSETQSDVQLIGCWVSEIGQQNQIFVLRGFVNEAVRQAERERYLMYSDQFASSYVLDIHIDDYTLFPFLKPLPPGRYGDFYEFREYDLVPTGLEPTMMGWRKAIQPRTSDSYSPVYAAFYATSGRLPRYLHIWPYRSLEQRLDVRTRAVADGVWPPENSGPQIQTMMSTICRPATYSPLR